MALTTRPMFWNSPLTGRPSMLGAIFWVRSPLATAAITLATSEVGRTRSSMRAFTAFAAGAHAAVAGPSRTRSVSRPLRPTARATLSSSRLKRALASARSLKARATSPCNPGRRVDRRTPWSPARAAVSARSSSSRKRSGGDSAGRPSAGDGDAGAGSDAR